MKRESSRKGFRFEVGAQAGSAGLRTLLLLCRSAIRPNLSKDLRLTSKNASPTFLSNSDSYGAMVRTSLIIYDERLLLRVNSARGFCVWAYTTRGS